MKLIIPLLLIGFNVMGQQKTFTSTRQLMPCCSSAYYKLKFVLSDSTLVLKEFENGKWRTNSKERVSKISEGQNYTRYKAVDIEMDWVEDIYDIYFRNGVIYRIIKIADPSEYSVTYN